MKELQIENQNLKNRLEISENNNSIISAELKKIKEIL